MKEVSQIKIKDIRLFLIFIGGLGVLPLFFVPWFLESTNSLKGFYTTLFLLGFVSFVSISLLRNKISMILPGGPVVASLFLLVILSFVSALLSPLSAKALIGFSFEIDTAVIALVSFGICVLTASLCRTYDRILYLSHIIVFSSLLVQIIFLLDVLFLHTFSSAGLTVAGEWFSASLFIGFTFLLSTAALKIAPLTHLMRVVYRMTSILSFILSFFFLFLLPLVAAIVGSFLFLFLYSWVTYINPKKDTKHRSTIMRALIRGCVITAILLTVVLVGGEKIEHEIQRIATIPAVSVVNPSWETSIEVFKETVLADKKSMFVGSGPNTFSQQWNLHKPIFVNTIPFWDTSFDVAKSFFVTKAVTTGLLGVLLWGLFLMWFLYAGVRYMFSQQANQRLKDIFIIFFVLALYCLLWAILSPIHVLLLVYTFVSVGVCVAILIQEKIFYSVVLQGFHFNRIFSTLLIVCILALTLWGVYLSLKKALSVMYYERGEAIFLKEGDVDRAQIDISRAFAYSSQDRFYRSLSEIQQVQIGALLSNEDKRASAGVREELDLLAVAAVTNARGAVESNEYEYLNWITLGNISSRLTTLSIEGSYDAGQIAFDKASSLNPLNPAPLFLRAYLASLVGNTSDVVQYAERAVALKPDYKEAQDLLESVSNK